MQQNIVDVDELPLEPGFKETYSIGSNNITAHTHGMFKYPCKFIPHIPRWAIRKYADSNNIGGGVLDPFAGSGTSLVESLLHGHDAYAIDPDPFSQLLIRVKTTPLATEKIGQLEECKEHVLRTLKNPLKGGVLPEYLPDIPQLNLWFNRKTVHDLCILKYAIKEIYDQTGSREIKEFLEVCMASLIRRVSNADDQSPKPYVSRKIKKIPTLVSQAFQQVFDRNLKGLKSFGQVVRPGCKAKLIGRDARQINLRLLPSSGLSLAVTSPPYINAFDYVRSLKLENMWLGYLGPDDLQELRKIHIGTEAISSKVYCSKPPETGIDILDEKINLVFRKDKKRAHIVYLFFKDMEGVMGQIYKILAKDGCYCIVIGDTAIREVPIPVHNILVDIGQRLGFKLDSLFSYIIKNRYLRFPRQGRGGYVKKDWVIALRR